MATTNVKPGWKTTEFWLTLAGNLVGGLSMVGALPVPVNIKTAASVAGGIVTAVSSAAYAISRAIAKRPANPSAVSAPTINNP